MKRSQGRQGARDQGAQESMFPGAKPRAASWSTWAWGMSAAERHSQLLKSRSSSRAFHFGFTWRESVRTRWDATKLAAGRCVLENVLLLEYLEYIQIVDTVTST